MAGPISSPNAGTLDKNDPRSIIDQYPMTIGQVIVVAITVMLNAMDGFDILSIAFASNGIASEWQVTTQALGIVLSMYLPSLPEAPTIQTFREGRLVAGAAVPSRAEASAGWVRSVAVFMRTLNVFFESPPPIRNVRPTFMFSIGRR